MYLESFLYFSCYFGFALSQLVLAGWMPFEQPHLSTPIKILDNFRNCAMMPVLKEETSMFTPDSLLDMAIDFEAQANGLTVSAMVSDAALASDYRGKAYDFRRKSMEATVCAEWMENHGITEAPMIGPFGNIKIEQHIKIRIKAGARVFGTGKDIPSGGKLTTRSYAVTATSIDNGYAMSAACG